MDDRIVEFCGLLRQNGLRVSVSETMDAVRALGVVGLDDRETVRATLRATAVKRAVDVETFERLFDLFFSGLAPVIEEITAATQQALDLDPAAFQKMLEDLQRFLDEQGIELSPLAQALLRADTGRLEQLLRPDPRARAVARVRSFVADVGTGRVVLVAIGLVAAVAVGWVVWGRGAPPPELDLPTAASDGAASMAPTSGPLTDGAGGVPSSTTEAGVVVVHVAGAVTSPGLYHLAVGARVADALDAAGGTTPDADVDRVNLAQPLTDGSRLSVPRVGEAIDPPAAVSGPATARPADGTSEGGDATPDSPVDLNTADLAELERLPGVGPSTAQAILDHRESNGPFRSVDDLLDVRGIGPAKLAALRDVAVVGGR